MALIGGIAHLFIAFCLLLFSIAGGHWILEYLHFSAESPLERTLFASAFFFVCFEVLLFFLSVIGKLQGWPLTVIAVLATVMTFHRRLALSQLWRDLISEWRSGITGAWANAGAALVGIFLVSEALLTMAPFSGSDAMHYHFTVPLLEEGHPLKPIFSLTHSFLIGQSHLLISLGLALGSTGVPLSLIFLGGVLTAVAMFAFGKRISSSGWALLAVLTLVATPMVFWQISTSGSPDIWMGFYTLTALLAAGHASQSGDPKWFILSAFFAGAAGGTKYTGWMVPLAIVFYCLVKTRSLKTATGSSVACLAAGVWPLLRNVAFTGDPFFPFLTRWLHPATVNTYALSHLLSDVRSPGYDVSLPASLLYPLALVLHGKNYMFGQAYGPVILALAPMLALVPWKNQFASIGGLV